MAELIESGISIGPVNTPAGNIPGWMVGAVDESQSVLQKPFLSKDVFRFVMADDTTSNSLAEDQLSLIRVVPNPYIAAERWEPRNTYSSGRGPRELHFINLPRNCNIRIFDVSGSLVDKIEHSSTLDNGTAIWDMLSSDNLEISYGVYVYHSRYTGNFREFLFTDSNWCKRCIFSSNQFIILVLLGWRSGFVDCSFVFGERST